MGDNLSARADRYQGRWVAQVVGRGGIVLHEYKMPPSWSVATVQERSALARARRMLRSERLRRRQMWLPGVPRG